MGTRRRVYVPLLPALLFTLAVVRAFDEPFDPALFFGCLVGLQLGVMSTGIILYQRGAYMLPVPRALGPWVPPADGAQVIVAVGVLGLIAGLMRLAPRTRPARWLERLGAPLAAFSYTLYLTHHPTLWFLALQMHRLPPQMTWFAAGRMAGWMAVCLGVAAGLYALFEARTAAVRRWLRARLGGKTPARPARHPVLPMRQGQMPHRCV